MRAFSILYPLLGIVLLLEVCWLFKLEKFGPIEVFLVVLAVYLILAKPVITPWLYRRCYRRRQHGAPHETILTFTDDAIDCDCPGHSHSTIEWPAILGLIESKMTVLLYISPAMFFNIPKRVLTESQLDELRSMLHSRQIPKGSPKPSSK